MTRGIPNPAQPGRCPSFDPYGGDLQCGRAIHEDDQCVFGGIAWKKGTPPEVSDREKVARGLALAAEWKTLAGDESTPALRTLSEAADDLRAAMEGSS